MPTLIEATPLRLPGLLLLEPPVYGDERGFLWEPYNRRAFAELGITCDFVQDNHSRSVGGVLRGMHFQRQPGQAKLVWVARGEVFDVAVDLRPDSETFGQWQGVLLNGTKRQQLFIPVGFAHGFCVLSEEVDFVYKLSSFFDPQTEMGFRWDDPEVGIEWPIHDPLLSDRDRQAPSFATVVTQVAR